MCPKEISWEELLGYIYLFFKILHIFLRINVYLFIWLCWVLPVVCRLSCPTACGILVLWSLSRNRTHVPCIGKWTLITGTPRRSPKRFSVFLIAQHSSNENSSKAINSMLPDFHESNLYRIILNVFLSNTLYYLKS